jgi:hypothetical protein
MVSFLFFFRKSNIFKILSNKLNRMHWCDFFSGDEPGWEKAGLKIWVAKTTVKAQLVWPTRLHHAHWTMDVVASSRRRDREKHSAFGGETVRRLVLREPSSSDSTHPSGRMARDEASPRRSRPQPTARPSESPSSLSGPVPGTASPRPLKQARPQAYASVLHSVRPCPIPLAQTSPSMSQYKPGLKKSFFE